ncbi:MAG: VPGUxxT family thioredoxin-like (seleno)protein, type 2 [Planctomycetota bacterium]
MTCSMLLSAMLTMTVPADQPVELGQVNWGRNLDSALQTSKSTGKPVLLLFQEIPGCHGCQVFGQEPLSHPLIVEALETSFVPVAIHNNKPGYDEKILKQFNEPSWNYPVMRVIDANGKDLIPRRDKQYSVHEVSTRLIDGLQAAKHDVPGYLNVLAAETAPKLETATFAMYCYWEGEGRIGALDGVVTTESGWQDGLEVVEVTFDPTRISYDTLLREAQSFKCATKVFAHNDTQFGIASKLGAPTQRITKDNRRAKDSDQKHTLRATALKYMPLTPGQQTKINAAIHTQTSWKAYLSPRQYELAKAVDTAHRHHPELFNDVPVPDETTDLAAHTKRLHEIILASSRSAGDERGS